MRADSIPGMIHALSSGTASLLAQAPAIPAVPAAPAAPGFSVTFWVLLAIAGLIGEYGLKVVLPTVIGLVVAGVIYARLRARKRAQKVVEID